MVPILAVVSTLSSGPVRALADAAGAGEPPGIVTDAPPVADTWGISGPDFVRGYALALQLADALR